MCSRNCALKGSLHTFRCAIKAFLRACSDQHPQSLKSSSLVDDYLSASSPFSPLMQRPCIAGRFYSLSITPTHIHIPRTAQIPEVATFGVPKAWEGKAVLQELKLRERAAPAGLWVGLSSCQNTGTSVCTKNLFPVQPLKSHSSGVFQNQTCLISLVLRAISPASCSSGILYTLYVNMETVTRPCTLVKD